MQFVLVDDPAHVAVFRPRGKLCPKPGGFVELAGPVGHFINLLVCLRVDGFGARSRGLAVSPVRFVFMIEGKTILRQILFRQDLFFFRTRMIEREGWRGEDFPYAFLGNRVLRKGGVVDGLFDFYDLLGLFVVNHDILINRHD